MTLFRLLLLTLAVPAFGQSSYTAYNRTESAAVGTQITTGILDSDITTNGYYLTASISPSPHTQFWVTNAHDNALRGSLLVGSTFFTGSGDSKTYCIRANGAGLTRICRYTFPTSARTGQFAAGWYWRFSPTTDLSDFVDTFYVDINGGDFAVAAFRDDAGASKAIRIHNNSAGTVGPDIAPLTSNTTYWVTILVDTNNPSVAMTKLAVFDPSTWRMLGISTLAAGTKGMVNYFEFGCSSGHTINSDFRMFFDDITIETGPGAVTNWPMRPAGATVIASSTSRTAYDQAYTNAVTMVGTNRDTISLPSGSSTWTSGNTFAKNGITVTGNGTNNTVITADGVFTAFSVSGSFNCFTNFQIKGDGTTDEADGFLITGNANRFTKLYLRELNVAFYCQEFGCIDKNVVNDCWRLARVIMPSGYYATYYPLALDSTNHMVIEDNIICWTSAKNQTGPQVLISSQVAQSWIFRHNYVELNNSSTDPAPIFDYHGDDSGGGLPVPGVSMQIYSNVVNILAGSVSGQKAVDVRGSRSMVYSNVVKGATYDSNQGIVLREERPSDVPNYLVNNTYVWENKHGVSGTTAMPVNDDANITAGVDYFTSIPGPLVQLIYPHPMRNEPLPAPPPFQPAPPKLRMVRLK